ncbi:putative THUMP domain-containing protein [Helianthus annuus]|nr:putative THUMP domain-containing protein [Helianthus annuus]KAJ0722433.1 putative THUMP domain-containing protein [Helianthus annuus]
MAELEVTNKNTAKDLDDAAAAAGEMKPWEQHSAVISIPRYDYKAPSSLLRRSFSGFLVTCPISLYFAPYLSLLHSFCSLLHLCFASVRFGYLIQLCFR